MFLIEIFNWLIVSDKLKNPLPFRMSVNSSADPDCKEVVMTIKLKCNIPTNKRWVKVKVKAKVKVKVYFKRRHYGDYALAH